MNMKLVEQKLRAAASGADGAREHLVFAAESVLDGYDPALAINLSRKYLQGALAKLDEIEAEVAQKVAS